MERPEKADYTNERCSPPLDEHSSLQARVRRVEQDVGRLHNRLELKTQELAKRPVQLSILRSAIATSRCACNASFTRCIWAWATPQCQ